MSAVRRIGTRAQVKIMACHGVRRVMMNSIMHDFDLVDKCIKNASKNTFHPQIDRCMRKSTMADVIAKKMLANHAETEGGRAPEWPSDAPTLINIQ